MISNAFTLHGSASRIGTKATKLLKCLRPTVLQDLSLGGVIHGECTEDHGIFSAEFLMCETCPILPPHMGIVGVFVTIHLLNRLLFLGLLEQVGPTLTDSILLVQLQTSTGESEVALQQGDH